MRRPVPGTPEFLCGPELSSLSALTDSQDGSTSHRSFRSSFTQARNEEGLALIRIPSSLHAESPAMKNGYELNGPTSTALTGPRRWKFSSLSLTTNIDAGAADNTTASLRFLSLEYLLCVLIELCFCVYGFVLLKGFCKREAHTYLHDLQHPFSGLVWLDSTGYDNKVDKQWSGFLYQYPTLICLALLLGLSSSVLRCVSSFNGSPSSTTAQSDAALSSSDDCPSGGAEYSDDEDLDKRCSNGALTLRQHTSRLARLCAAPLQWLCSLVADCWLLPVLYTVVGVIFIAVVHGPHFFLPILLIAANYVVFTRLQRWCPYWAFMAIMWVVHTGLLYIIELYAGFEGTYWLQYLFPTSFESTFNVLGPRFGRPGLWRQHMRWCVAFRMTTLRLIAFNYDLWEATHSAARARERATDKHDATCIECAQLREQNSRTATALPAEASRCYKYRTECPRDLSDYNFVNYLAYIVFPPLYLAGPMSSFNAFVSYMRVPSASTTSKCVIAYALGTLRSLATEVVLLHFVHIAAISRHPWLILKMSQSEKAFYMYYTLAYLWLKFSFIWKSSRLFAMFSGIEVPEDMRRCFSNTTTVRNFWRDWHASFNLWIVRYMYIPMGGSRTKLFSVFPIFLFIALWHDPALHLLKWALCIAVMFVLEMAVSGCFGWVTNVFRREMAARAACNRGDGDNAGVGVEEVGVTHSPQSSGQCGGVPAVLLRPAARFAARRMSPRARSWSYRMLRVLAGMFSVFGLILANLIGFSMQNSSANVEKTDYTASIADADNAIIRSLQNPSVCFVVGLVMAMYAFASVGAIERDLTYHHTKMLKARFGLK